MMSEGYSTHDSRFAFESAGKAPNQVSVKFTETVLHTYPNSEPHGKISSGYGAPMDADDSFSKPASSGMVSHEAYAMGWTRMLTVAAYKPYFDVDTADVLDRIKDSLFPLKGNFSEKTMDNPDLYGPFWICTTLVFVAASTGTSVVYLDHKMQKKEWAYDINLVKWSAGLFYGYVIIVPLALYNLLKYFSTPLGLVQLCCLYGYSLFIFIPASCLSILPTEIFRWVITAIAGFISASFLALNLRAHILSAGERWLLIVSGIFLLQLALALVLKAHFFTVAA